MPESVYPFAGTGGKFAGIRITEFGIPFWSRISQKLFPCRNCSALPLPSGMTQLPTFKECFGASTFEVEK